MIDVPLTITTLQINKSSVTSNGRSVEIKDSQHEDNFANILIWHFIWSKYYYYNKHFGRVFSLIYFVPTIIRILFRILINRKKEVNYKKYLCRLNGLQESMLLKKSYMRLEKISNLL